MEGFVPEGWRSGVCVGLRKGLSLGKSHSIRFPPNLPARTVNSPGKSY